MNIVFQAVNSFLIILNDFKSKERVDNQTQYWVWREYDLNFAAITRHLCDFNITLSYCQK